MQHEYQGIQNYAALSNWHRNLIADSAAHRERNFTRSFFWRHVKILILEHKIVVRNPPDRFRKRKSRGGKRINLNKDSLRLCGTEESFVTEVDVPRF